jgi:hypothetical protein
MPSSILRYAKRRYLFVATALCVMAVALYAWHDPIEPPNGGTWLGYAYGAIGAALILYLLYFGVRRRRYASRLGTVQGWLSAHVYLGLALVLIVTLHTGFQFGFNVHTLAFALMVLTVASGVFGVYAYTKYPTALSANAEGMSRDAMLVQVADIDRRARQMAAGLPSQFGELVGSAIGRTVLGGTAWAQLAGRDLSQVVLPRGQGHVVLANAEQDAALDWLAEQQSRSTDAESAAKIAELATLLRAKRRLLARLRQDIRIRGLLEAWLFLHVPLSFALLAALLAHVAAVYLYW